MAVQLTPNAIAAVTAGDVNAKPLVQIVDIKLIGSQERYRFLLSDSVATQHAMLATQLNDRVKKGSVKKGSVVQLIEYVCSDIENRKIIVVLDMNTVILECDIIGNPKLLGQSDSTARNSDSTTQKSNLNSNFQPPATVSGNQLRTANNGANVLSFPPVVQPPYQPPPNYKVHGAIRRNDAPARVIPISALNPYQERWTIKARVTVKSDLRRYNNARGEGKVFWFDLLDSNGGEIRVTCFNAIVDRFYETIEVGRVYLISNGRVKPARKNFNHLKNDWEIFLEATSTVDLCPEEDGSIPKHQFAFKPINEIESADNDAILDVIGIVTSVNASVPIMRKNGMEIQRRILNLRDCSGKTVDLTLWGEFCNREGQQLQEMFDSGIFPVLAVKAGRVKDFSGKSIGTIPATQIFTNPDFPEAHKLRSWFDQVGKDIASHSISKDVTAGAAKNEIRKTISQIQDEGLGRSYKPDWITVRATITHIITDTFCYAACPLMIGDKQCSKKVTMSLSNDKWQCDRCNQEFEECDYRYLLRAQVHDHSGSTWVLAFQESGTEIMGCSAKDLHELRHKEWNEAKFIDIVRGRLFKQFLFKLKVIEERHDGEQRVKLTVFKADEVNHASEGKYLLDSISKFSR